MVERERIIEIVVAALLVFTMIGVMLYVGTVYGGESGTLSSDGGEALVTAIIGFIFLSTAVGVLLAFVTNESEDADTEADAEASSTA